MILFVCVISPIINFCVTPDALKGPVYFAVVFDMRFKVKVSEPARIKVNDYGSITKSTSYFYPYILLLKFAPFILYIGSLQRAMMTGGMKWKK